MPQIEDTPDDPASPPLRYAPFQRAPTQALTLPSPSLTLPPPTDSTLFKTPITITVGPQSRPFTLHRELLTHTSPYFAACLNPTHAFLESTTNTIDLPTDRPDAFEYFVQWLYTRRLDHEAVDAAPLSSPPPTTTTTTTTTTNNNNNNPPPAFFPLLHLYALADKLCIEPLRNDVVDRIARIAVDRNTVPAPDDTRILYGEIRDGAPVGRLVLDLFVGLRTERVLGRHADSWDERFLRDLVVRLKGEVLAGERVGKGGRPWVVDLCGNYHEHAHAVGMGVGMGGCVGKR